jgi:predicted  nucleic acid-binding Zn-ribbon protein
MTDDKSMLQDLIDSIKQQRDEIALQIHLGKSEAKEEWSKMEDELHNLAKKYEPMKDVISDTSSEVVDGLKLVAEEILAGFDRIRKML